MDDPLTRRRVVATGATVAAGSGYLLYSTDQARADVTLDEWTVSNASFDQPVDPVVDATVQWAYEVSDDVDRLRVELLIDGESLAFKDLNTSSQSAESSTDVSARVTEHTQLSAEDFGSGTETTLTVTARFRVYKSDETVIAEATATDTTTVTVAEGAVVAVGGSGEVVTEQ